MKISLPLVLAMAASTANARQHYGGILTPHRRLARDLESSFDLVSEILSSSPIYNMVTQGNTVSPNGSATTTSTLPRAPAYAVTHDGKTDVISLRMEMPGVAADDLAVTLENDSLLRIHGKRLMVTGDEVEFDQHFQLDKDVDPSSLAVTLRNGILQVQASKRSKSVKQIPVQTIATDQQTAIAESSNTISSEQTTTEDITITEDDQ
jgi:HSP20 family molecular chaperone IbpA